VHPDRCDRVRRVASADTGLRRLGPDRGPTSRHGRSRHRRGHRQDPHDAARRADQYDAEARALLRGAVVYFIEADDTANDLTDVIGFDDDVRVLNAVLDALGRQDLLIAPV